LTTSPPGGETAAQVAERALAAVEQIRSRHPGGDERVLAVSHKATLRILAAALIGAPLATYRTRWAQDESALNLLELRAGKESVPAALERYRPPGTRSGRDHSGRKIVTLRIRWRGARRATQSSLRAPDASATGIAAACRWSRTRA